MPTDPAPTGDASGTSERRWTIRHVATTGSTNHDLLDDLTAVDRTVLVADHQTAGRGRLDRAWDSPPGVNLLASIKFASAGARSSELPRRVALAAAEAVERLSGRQARLKWPNDVLLDGVKVAGVLAQMGPGGEVVVGIGVNVGWSPPDATRIGDAITPGAVLDGLLDRFDELPADADEFHQRYRAQLATIGQRVRVELPAGDLVGTAIDVDPDGRLLVVDEAGTTRRVDVGDIVHLRPAY